MVEMKHVTNMKMNRISDTIYHYGDQLDQLLKINLFWFTPSRARWRYPDCRIKIRMVPNGINGFLNFHPLLLFPLSSFPTHTHLTLLIYLFKRIVSSLMRETRETSCHNWVKDSKFGGSPMIKKICPLY